MSQGMEISIPWLKAQDFWIRMAVRSGCGWQTPRFKCHERFGELRRLLYRKFDQRLSAGVEAIDLSSMTAVRLIHGHWVLTID
jgi:hypothetical protein